MTNLKKSITDRHTHKVTYGGGAHLKIYILGLYGYEKLNARVKCCGLGLRGNINWASSGYAPGVIPGMFQNILKITYFCQKNLFLTV